VLWFTLKRRANSLCEPRLRKRRISQTAFPVSFALAI
jgi:hypothetical protein